MSAYSLRPRLILRFVYLGLILFSLQPSALAAPTPHVIAEEPPIEVLTSTSLNLVKVEVEVEVKDYVDITSKGILCNCYLYQKTKYYPDLPTVNNILNNLQPSIAGLAVFYYPKSGLYHFAKVTWSDGYNFSTDEANLSPCKVTQRKLNLDYSNLIGFWQEKI